MSLHEQERKERFFKKMETETKKRGGILRWFAVLMAIFIAAGTVFGMTQMGGDSRVYAAESTWIYVDGANGNDSNDGSSAGGAVKSWEKAKSLLGNKEGGIYVSGTVQATGNINTENSGKQSVKRADGFTGVMFEVPNGETATFYNIDVDGEDKRIDAEVIKPNSNSTLNFLSGAVFHDIGYVEDKSVNEADYLGIKGGGPGAGYPDNTIGGRVCSLVNPVNILVDGATFRDNDGKGIFFTPVTDGTMGINGVYVTMKSGTVTNNKGFFYHNECINVSQNILTIYNALITGNDASNIGERYSAYAERTGVVFVCDFGQMILKSQDGVAIFDNANYDLMTDYRGQDGDNQGQNIKLRGTSISDTNHVMLGGGNPNWGGFEGVGKPKEGKPSFRTWYGRRSNPSAEAKAAARENATSIFEGNGAVIDSNGTVQLGRYSNETPPVTPEVPDAPTPGTEEEEEEPEPQPEEPTTPVVPEEPETTDETSITATIEGTKTLTGKNLENGQFTFELLDNNGNVIDTKTNDANGKVVFDGIKYTEAGTYNYKVREKNDGQEGIVYDTEEKAVTVNVTKTATQNQSAGTATAATEESNFPTSVTNLHPEDWGQNTEVRLEGPIVKDANGNIIEGAQVTLIRASNGTPLYKWLSDKGGLNVKLVNGETYTLKAAKNGYTLSDVSFTVSATQGGTAAPNNGENYLPKKHATGTTGAAIEVTYNQGGAIDGGWYSPKSVTFADGTTEHVFCGANYKSASQSDYPKRTIWNADYSAWQSPTGVNWQKGMIKPSEASWNRWLDRVAYLYSKEYRDTDQANANEAWNQAGDPGVMTGWELRDAVQKVLYNGYPYNAAGFTNTGALRKTTQEALFYVLKCGKAYKEGVRGLDEGGYRAAASDKDMFDALVNFALKGNNNGSMKNYPDGTETYVYWTANNDTAYTVNAQPLIGIYAPYNSIPKIEACIVGNKAETTTEENTLYAEAGTFSFTNKYEETTVEYNGSLGTTVYTNKGTASANAALQAEAGSVEVLDKISYTNLQPNNEYKVYGELVKVGDDYVVDKVAGPNNSFAKTAQGKYFVKARNNNDAKWTEATADQKAMADRRFAGMADNVEVSWAEVKDLEEMLGMEVVATKQATPNKKANAQGTGDDWIMTFGNVTLEAGAKYVVFESAENADAAKAEAGDKAEHHDAGDAAQTIIVKETTPKAVKQGHVIINKVDEDGKLLPGAEFEILKDNNVVRTINADNNGDIVISDIEPGSYVLHEKTAPEGYNKADDMPFTVEAKSYTSHLYETAEEPNRGVGSLAILEDGKLVASAACINPDYETPGNGTPYKLVFDTEYVHDENDYPRDQTVAKVRRVVDAYVNHYDTLVSKLGGANFPDASVHMAVQSVIGNMIKANYWKTEGMSKINGGQFGNTKALYDYLVTVANSDKEVKGHVAIFEANDGSDKKRQDLVLLKLFGADVTMTDTKETQPEITNTTAKLGNGEGKATATAQAAAEYTLKENETKVSLSDVVYFKGLDKDQKYVVRATAYDKDGKQVRQFTTDVEGITEGDATVTFRMPVEAGTYNIKAELLLNGTVVAEHNGKLGEVSERAVVKKAPKITNTTANAGGVEATDDAAAEYTLAEGEINTTLKDTVEFEDLDSAKEYTIKAIVFDADNNEVENKTETVNNKTNGSIEVTFNNVGEGTYNIKAELICDGKVVATHNGNFDDESERAVIKKTPEKVSIKVDKKWVAADGTTTVDAPKDASVRVQVLANGQPVKGQVATIMAKHNWTFTFKDLPKQDENGKDITYTLQEVSFKGEGFERAGLTGDVENGFILTNKKEPNGDLKTNASDAEDGDKTLDPEKDVKIKDIVTFENLKAGKTYTLSGELHKKNADDEDGGVIAYTSCELTAGENATVDGMTFTPSAANGSVVMTFTVDASKLAGKKIVVFEKAESEGIDAILHHEIKDEDQTVEVDNPKVEVKVTKKWTDRNGEDAANVPADASATFRVLADGTAVGDTKTVNATNWEAKFENLDKFNADGNEIVYTIEETAFTGEGFEAGAVEQDGDDSYTFVAENKEMVPGEITARLQLEKAIPGLEGSIPTFKFILEGGADGAEIVNGTRWTNRSSHKLNNPFVVKFTKEGEYTFTVKEDKTLTGEEYAGVNFTAQDQTVKFVVVPDGNTLKVESVDGAEGSGLNWTVKDKFNNEEKTYEVKINKTDMGGQEIEGAKIKVTDATGKTVKEWTSVAGETMDITVKPGQYTLTEVSAPEGYVAVTTQIKFTVAADGKVTVNTTKVKPEGAVEYKDGVIVLKDALKKHDVSINKTDMGGQEIEGAKIKVTDATGKTVKEWTSVAGETMDFKVVPGNYTLTEVNAPEGYQCVTTKIKFTVDMQGKVAVEKVTAEPAGAIEQAEDGTIILKNEYKDHEVKINKTDIADGEEIEGAVITVTGDNDFKQTWVSEKGKTMDITVKPGKYTLVENSAPEGYQRVTTKVVFEVAVDGTVTVKNATVKPAGAVEYKDGVIVLKNKAKDVSIETNATDKADGDHIVKPVKQVTIVDEVSYTNLLVGKEYTISGTLHIKNADGTDGGELKVDGKAVTAEKTFTATKANGSEKLEFTFDASALDGKTVVAFEKCIQNGKVVATHEDITDEAQSVDVKGEKVKVNVTKTWNGEAADEITVKLTRNGKEIKEEKLNAENQWKYTWSGLAKEDKNGKTYTYAVEEIVPEGYTQTKQISKTDNKGNVTAEFENTKDEEEEEPEEAKVTVKVTKAWADGVTPAESVSVKLNRNGAEYDAQTLNADNKWTYTWSDLEKADKDGNVYSYEVAEIEVPGFYQSGAKTESHTDDKGNVNYSIIITNDKTPEKSKGEIKTQVEVKDGKTTIAVGGVDAPAGVTTKDAKEVTVVDHISYTGLTKDAVYKVSGTLNEVENGKVVKEVAKASADLKADGKTPWTITFEKVTIEPGKTYVVFEKAVNKVDEADEAAHEDANDSSQTIVVVKPEETPVVPEITTTASISADSRTITDVVDYTGLDTAKTYTLKGKLMDKATQKEVNTSYYTVAPVTVTPKAANGKAEMVFTLTDEGLEALKGKSIVVYEKLTTTETTDNGTTEEKEVAKHEDITSEDQTVDVPEDETYEVKINKTDMGGTEVEGATITVTDAAGKKVDTWVSKANETMDIVVKAGDYKLVEETAPAGYQKVTTTIEFTVTEEGKVQVTTSKVEPAGACVYENGVLILKDAIEETPVVPAIATKAGINGKSTITDEVSYENLEAGKTYKLVGKLMDKATQKEVDAKYYTCAPVEVTPTAANGKAKMVFTLTADGVKALAGKSIVVFEKLFTEETTTDENGNSTTEEKEVAKHEDITDADQTVDVPEEETHEVKINKTDLGGKEIDGAVITVTGAGGFEKTWTSKAGETFDLVLKAGDYKFVEVAAPAGYQKVTTEIKFTVAEDGKVTVADVTVEPAGAVEYKDGVIILKDAIEETPVVPAIATKAGINGKSTITDEVSYENLEAGKTYKLVGKLMDKATQKEVDAKYYTCAPVEVTPTAANGKAKMVFTLTADGVKALAGKSIVVFEKLFTEETTTDENGNSTTEEKEVAKHEDITDADQTVDVPEEETHEVKINKTDLGGKEIDGAVITVTGAGGFEKTWTSKAGETFDLVLKAGDYKFVEVAAPAGYQKVTTEIKFTVAEDGKVTVADVTVEPAGAVEYKDGVIILKDAIEETPVVPAIATKAGINGKSTITDVVDYTGLDTAKTYTLKGKLMDKATQNEVDANYYTCSATKVKPTAANGTALMIFDLTKEGARALSGREIVVYEKLFEVKVNDDNTTTEEEVAKHEDITDKNQTVKVPEKENPTVEISKTAVADSAELPGAKLVITKKGSEEVLYQHTSTNQTWKVKLEPGEYTLTEITAPKGYEVAESIDFTVNENGLAGGGKVHMEDAPTPEEPKPEITEVTVNKVWDDNNNQDGKRTENVTVNLLADGTAVAKYVLNSSNNWTHTFTALPKKNAEGKEFVYTVVEAEVPAGYEAAVNGFTITNKHTPETVTITGTKTWNDADNQDGKRPASITVNLLANGTVKDSKTVTQKDNWTYTWKDLPKYENGSEIKYTVTENKVEGYQATSDGINIINNYTPGKTSVSVVKAWADENDKDAIRPASVSATLYADGATVDTQVLSADNGWTYTWTDLDEMKDGKTIVYTVDEAVVPEGYGKAVTENNGTFVITNTHTPSKEEKENPTVTISKTDAATSAELPGATLVIKDASGEDVVTFVSKSEPTEFKLAPGEYTLTEITAPQGYEVAETIAFTVDENGLVGSDKVEMKDAPIVEKENPTVTISKTDAATSEELPGAELIIRNSEGKIVENFVSGSEPTLVQLAPGEYTLTELTAPKGYQVAETITFTVDENGLVGSDKVEMIDEPTKVTISKQAVGGGAELEGATLLVRNANGEVIEEWVSGGEAHVFNMLPVGEYTLTEISAPKGYAVAETIRFRILENGKVECFNGTEWADAEGTVVMFDAIEESRVIKPHVDDIPKMPDDTSPEPTVIPHEDEENEPETPKSTDEPKKEEESSEDKTKTQETPRTEKKEDTPEVKKPETVQKTQTPVPVITTRRAGTPVVTQTPAAATATATATRTGDSNDAAMWIAIASVAAAAIAAMAVVVVRRRRTDM